MKKVVVRLNVLNSYLKCFPKSKNMSLSTGEMIDVVIGMLLNTWRKIMTQTGTEPGEIEFDKFITHLNMLEETASEHKGFKRNYDGEQSHLHQNNKGQVNEKSKTEFTSVIIPLIRL